ncbi:MAG: hypothetical protein U0326_30915 [Polyangiales bacterium]
MLRRVSELARCNVAPEGLGGRATDASTLRFVIEAMERPGPWRGEQHRISMAVADCMAQRMAVRSFSASSRAVTTVEASFAPADAVR